MGCLLGPTLMQPVFFLRAWWFAGGVTLMAAASVTPPGSLDVLQPGFSKTLLGIKLEDKYLCSACKNVLRRPFQAQCGHRYCSFCLSSILRYGGRGGPGRVWPERCSCRGKPSPPVGAAHCPWDRDVNNPGETGSVLTRAVWM